MSTAQPYRPKPPKEKSPSALDLLDESFHRLRAAPAATLGIYYAGSLPFILAFLYFWADLSHSADAERYGTGAALGLALVFLWMKACHALFAERMRAIFGARTIDAWSVGSVWNLVIVQSVLQSLGLFVLFFGLILTLPAGWTYAFCQSATAIGAGEHGSVREVLRRSVRAAVLWPRQNHAMLLILSLLGLFVWLNILLAVFLLPQLLKIVTGDENAFTRGGMDFFNSTFVMVTVSLAFLLLDPVVKTFYALRCFYADSLHSGDDLKSELRALPVVKPAPATGAPAAPGAPGIDARRPVAPVAAALLLGGLILLPGRAQASPAPVPVAAATAATSAGTSTPAGTTAQGSVQPPELSRSIDEVMHRREFAWRVPPAPSSAPPEKTGFFVSALRWVGDVSSWVGAQIGHVWQFVSDWFHALMRRWLRDQTPASEPAQNSGFNGGTLFLQRLIYALIALIVVVLAFQGWKVWRRRNQSPDLAGRAAPAVFAVPDLSNEEVLASQLPEDEWLQLARQLLAAGEHRLAVRAFYLSILALLGARGLLAIARHKSNRDYLLELRRRARDQGDLQSAFTRNVNRYERVWYGPHPASQELFDQLLADRQIISDAAPAPPAFA